MIYEGAPCHSEMALSIPDNMMTQTLPAHCPELNPTEHIWDEGATCAVRNQQL
jgi:hypothetical protein